MVAYPKDYLSDVVENQGKLFDLGFITNPTNGRVKALSKACLDRTYYVAYTYPKELDLDFFDIKRCNAIIKSKMKIFEENYWE